MRIISAVAYRSSTIELLPEQGLPKVLRFGDEVSRIDRLLRIFTGYKGKCGRLLTIRRSVQQTNSSLAV